MLKKKEPKPKLIRKCPTGISGFDEITLGGLPKDRATLICGGPGSGKSMLCMEFLVRGASEFKEPGLFIAFEESEQELAQNIASLGFNVEDLIKKNLLILNHIQINRAELTEIGPYNLDGLFIQLEHLITKFRIKRVVLDTLEVLFSNLKNKSILRSELQRLFHWFKSKNVTLLVTAEKGGNTMTRYGLEEYVADCVITLDNRIEQQISTRRIRIAKYRGSMHGNNEYPFIITTRGLHIISITSLKLDFKSSTKRISSGIKQLDTMLSDKGFYCGSSILVSGPAGIGKSSFAAAFANGICQGGQKCLYLAFEESVEQIIRNMNSIGIHLEQWVNKGLLKFSATNPNSSGLESHLAYIQNEVEDFKPDVTIIDPITNLRVVGNTDEVHDTLSILISYFKRKQITVMFLNLVSGEALVDNARTIEGISSLMDTWIFLQYLTDDGERTRLLSIIKSRGMAHSNQFREVHLSSKGIFLHEVYIGAGKMLTGAARLIQSSEKEVENSNIQSQIKHKERKSEISRKEIENKINSLIMLLENAKEEKLILAAQKKRIKQMIANNRAEIAKIRMADKLTTEKLSVKRKHGKSKNVGKKQK